MNLERLRRLWRTQVVGDECESCYSQVAKRFVVMAPSWTFSRMRGRLITGWLCAPCARALGIPEPDRDDR